MCSSSFDRWTGIVSGMKVGYWLNEKKCQRFGILEFGEICRKKNIHLVKLKLDEPFENQGSFDLIFHKMTNVFAQALNGDAQAMKIVSRFEEFAKNHPETIIMDPLSSVQQLMLRKETYNLLKQCMSDDDILTPAFVEVDSLEQKTNEILFKRNGITFPVVCKPLHAGGGKAAHDMSVVFNMKNLKDCQLPCIAQSFVNHGAILYKLFVLGPVWFVVARPSLKNFYEGDRETINFNSHEVSKPDSISHLNKLDAEDKMMPLPQPDHNIFQRIISKVRKALTMDLIGIDVVIDSKSSRYAIIDVNAFPSYECIPKLLEIIAELIQLRLHNGFSCSDDIPHSLQKFLPKNLTHLDILDQRPQNNVDYVQVNSCHDDSMLR